MIIGVDNLKGQTLVYPCKHSACNNTVANQLKVVRHDFVGLVEEADSSLARDGVYHCENDVRLTVLSTPKNTRGAVAGPEAAVVWDSAGECAEEHNRSELFMILNR